MCGTQAAYRAHLRRGEPVDDACAGAALRARYRERCGTCGKPVSDGVAKCRVCRRLARERVCEHCREWFTAPSSGSGQRYCSRRCVALAQRNDPDGRRFPPKPPGWTVAAGYGREHQAARVTALAAFAAGDPCARCGSPMNGEDDLDLDHTDDRTGYLGLSHASCNRRAAAIKANGKPPSGRTRQRANAFAPRSCRDCPAVIPWPSKARYCDACGEARRTSPGRVVSPVTVCACGSPIFLVAGRADRTSTRCHGCLVAMATEAAELRATGAKWQAICDYFGYPNPGSLYGLVRKYAA